MSWFRIGAALCVLAAATPAAAQGTGAPPYRTLRHDEDYSYLKDVSRRSDLFDPIKYMRLSDAQEGWYVTFGGELRERYEYFRNTQWNEANGSDGFLLQRYLLFADLHFGPRLRLFTNVESVLEGGRDGGPRPTDEDRIDLHEAFIDWEFDPARKLSLRVGRQEISLGSQRLVSIRKGPNAPRSFDGVDVIAHPGSWRLDAFATRPVETDPGSFDDGADRSQKFWGVYATGPLRALEHANIDLYYLGLDRDDAHFDQGTATETRETAGARIWKGTAPWDYNFEAVYQWGRFGTGTINAWTVASDTGFTFTNAAWRPRASLKTDVTSGDRDPDAQALQSFNPLFPRGSYFGENQLVGPVNHIDLHPSIDLHPVETLTVNVSWMFFWRESLNDGLYGVPGNLLRSSAGTSSRYVGSQPSLTVTWAPNHHLAVVTDFEYFVAGPFLEESGSSDNVTFAASWLTFTF